jgi:hypothetical protein
MDLKQVLTRQAFNTSIFIVFSSHYHAGDIVKNNNNSIMIPGKQKLLKVNSQCVNPTTIGWFLHSNPTMEDYKDL